MLDENCQDATGTKNETVCEETSSKTGYARHARGMMVLGLHPLPIGEDTKYPPMKRWQHICDRMPTQAELRAWAHFPGIGLAMGSRIGDDIVVAIDVDVEGDDLDLLLTHCPISPMEKFGRKGITRFFRADPSVVTKHYAKHWIGDDGKPRRRGLLDLLAHGSQTVVPPTMHPDVGRPYKWTAGPVRAADLPILDADAIARLEDGLERLGWDPARDDTATTMEAAGEARRPLADDDDASVSRRLNDRAIGCLSRWVPLLDLYKLKPARGGFEAVNTLRASGSGRPVETRKRNLKIHPKGIVDKGSDETWTPIGFVADFRGGTYDEAFTWLADVTGLTAETNAGVAWDDLLPNFLKRREREQREEAEARERVDAAPVPPTPSIFTWDDRVANSKDEHEWLIREILSRRGVSMIWGQSGVGKGFVTLEIAACIVLGEPFFGQKVKAHGGVLFAFGEGKGSMAQRMNALREGRFGSSPLNPATGEPMDRDRLPIMWFPVSGLSNDATSKVFAANIREAKQQMVERHGRTLRLVILDTLNASFGFADDPGSALATNAMKRLGDLGTELDLLFLVVHHAGKSVEAGETGTHAWRASVEESVNVHGEKHSLLGTWSNRRIILVKARDGTKESWNQPFELRSVDLGINAEGEPLSSSIIERVGSGAPVADTLTCGGGPTIGAARAMRALTAALATSGTPIVTPDGSTVHAARSAVVRASYEPDDPGKPDVVSRRFRRDVTYAMTAGTICRGTVDGETWLWAAASNDN